MVSSKWITGIFYRNRFVTQYITYLNIWGALSKTLSSLSTNDQLMPSTGFKMNYLIKWSAGGISKLSNAFLFFLIKIFSQFNPHLFDACFNISKMFFYPSFRISFWLSYMYLFTILAIDLISAWFIFGWNVIFQVGIQKIFDAVFVLWHTTTYYPRRRTNTASKNFWIPTLKVT